MSWFRRNALRNFETIVKPRLAGKPATYLEIGVWRGDSLVWMLENVLTHEDAMAVGIDPWKETADCPQADMDFNRRYVINRCAPFGPRMRLVEMPAAAWLTVVNNTNMGLQYDFIYIDGDHSPQSVMLDLLLSWPLLKTGGLMILDDYYVEMRGNRGVKPAVDAVMPIAFGGQYTQLFADKYQIGFEKTGD